MTSILDGLEEVYLSDLGPPTQQRKLRFRWELARLPHCTVGVNTSLANRGVAELLASVPEALSKLNLHGRVQREVRWESLGQRARFDFQIGDPGLGGAILEVKQVTMRVQDRHGVRLAAFPDAVTARGKRHLELLTKLRRDGHRTLLLYAVLRSDVDSVRTAGEVDPAYRDALEEARASGVECHAVRLEPTLAGVRFGGWLPFSEI